MKIANLAQIVNVIAPIITRGDDILLQSIYHVFAMYSHRRTGTSLQTVVDGPTCRSPSYGPVTMIDSSAILDGDRLTVFCTNRSLHDEATVEISLADRTIDSVIEAEIVTGDDAKSENSFDRPDAVIGRPFERLAPVDGGARAVLPPLSTAALVLRTKAVR